MSPVVAEPEYLTQSGLAELLQVSVRTVQRLSKQAGFPEPISIRNCYRWSRAEVVNFLQTSDRKRRG